MPGCGEPSPCPVACVLCIISRINAASPQRAPSWPHIRPERMVDPPYLLPTNGQPMSMHASPMTAPLNHHRSPTGLVARASTLVGSSMQSGVMPTLTHVVSQGGWLKYGGESSLAHRQSSQRCLAANKSTPLMSNGTTSHRVTAMDDSCAKHFRIQRKPLTCNSTLIWKMRCSISCDRICL